MSGSKTLGFVPPFALTCGSKTMESYRPAPGPAHRAQLAAARRLPLPPRATRRGRAPPWRVVAWTHDVYRMAMITRRSSRRPPRRGSALLVLLVLVAVAAGAALLVHPPATAAPLDPNIFHEQALIDAGLSSAPDPAQPTRPIAVDRVLLDGTATYVQYHIAGPHAPPGDPTPTLSDDHGTSLTGNTSSSLSSTTDWPLPFPLPAWFPWRPPTIRRGYLILPPLPPTARAAVLQFGAPGGPGGPGAGETIRVPLGPRVAGLTLAFQEIGVAHLIYTYTRPGGTPYSGAQLRPVPSSAPPDPFAPLLAADGRPVPAVAPAIDCAAAGGLRCAITVVFPPQPSGTRLTLTIRAIQRGNPFAPITQRPLHGPWRLPATTP